MKISKEAFEMISQETFVNYFIHRLEEQGESLDSEVYDPAVRKELWRVAQGAGKYGLTTIGALLVYVQIHWEFGLDCLERITAFKSVVEDSALVEHKKVEKLWQVRCALFEALGG